MGLQTAIGVAIVAKHTILLLLREHVNRKNHSYTASQVYGMKFRELDSDKKNIIKAMGWQTTTGSTNTEKSFRFKCYT